MSNNSSCGSSFDWFLTSGYVGAGSSVTAIVLILCSKAYKDFSFRLYLYLATSTLALSVCWCVVQIILMSNSTNVSSGILHGLIAFFSLLIALLSCWLSFHILLIVTCSSTRVACLKKQHFEIAGLVLVLVLSLPIPILIISHISSPIPVYDSVCNFYEQLEHTWIFLIISAASIFGVIFISIAIVALIIQYCCSTQLNGGVRKFYRKALKAALPFLLLQICGFLFSSSLAIIL